MYGAEPGKPSFANNCLLARRLVERGVRFVQLFHEAWDQHGNSSADLKKNCNDTDQACAALIKDLKQRGMLEDTLVIWGGEFGRTPMVQGGDDGRDHHPNAFTMWMAGGGIKPGITLGETDEFGFNATERQSPRARSARDDSAPARLRSHEADLPFPGPRFPPDRCARRSGEEAARRSGVIGMLFHDLVPTIQIAIGPVILISGVGLLLLSMTNRLGRVIDRARQLCDVVRRSSKDDRDRLVPQLYILSRRARVIRSAIALSTASVLLVAVLIIGLFLSALFHWETAVVIALLFIACLAALIGFLIVFLHDINLALHDVRR